MRESRSGSTDSAMGVDGGVLRGRCHKNERRTVHVARDVEALRRDGREAAREAVRVRRLRGGLGGGEEEREERKDEDELHGESKAQGSVLVRTGSREGCRCTPGGELGM